MGRQEREILELFVEKVDLINQQGLSTILQSPTSHSFSVQYNLKATSIVSYSQLPLDELYSFAVTLRLFLQNNDRISINKITILLNKLSLPSPFKSVWNDNNAAFNTYLDSPPSRSEEVKTRRELLHTFLYGEIAHTHAKYREKVKIWKIDTVIGPEAHSDLFEILKYILDYLLNSRAGVRIALKLLN